MICTEAGLVLNLPVQVVLLCSFPWMSGFNLWDFGKWSRTQEEGLHRYSICCTAWAPAPLPPKKMHVCFCLQLGLDTNGSGNKSARPNRMYGLDLNTGLFQVFPMLELLLSFYHHHVDGSEQGKAMAVLPAWTSALPYNHTTPAATWTLPPPHMYLAQATK